MNLPVEQFARLGQANLELALKLGDTLMASSERLYDINGKLLKELVAEAGVAAQRTLGAGRATKSGKAGAMPADHWESLIAEGEQWRQATLEGVSAAFDAWRDACLETIAHDARPSPLRKPCPSPWPVPTKSIPNA